MRQLSLAILILCFSSTAIFAAKDDPSTALGAIKVLPRGEWKKIARIEARDGTPTPERWHIIVHDPKDENGLHEYVVAGGEVVASRTVSQFAESVKAEDVVNSSALKVDSDKVAKLAQAYAQANNITLVALDYALKKEGAEASPLWNVKCFDEFGKEVGRLVVSAGKGTVVSHEGFTAEPGSLAQIETESTTDADRGWGRSRKPVVRVVPNRPVPTPIPTEKKGFFGRVGDFFTKPPQR
jgi:hypothetical protein